MLARVPGSSARGSAAASYSELVAGMPAARVCYSPDLILDAPLPAAQSRPDPPFGVCTGRGNVSRRRPPGQVIPPRPQSQRRSKLRPLRQRAPSAARLQPSSNRLDGLRVSAHRRLNGSARGRSHVPATSRRSAATSTSVTVRPSAAAATWAAAHSSGSTRKCRSIFAISGSPPTCGARRRPPPRCKPGRGLPTRTSRRPDRRHTGHRTPAGS